MGGFVVRRCVGVGVVLLVGAWAVPVGAEEPSGGTVPAQVTMADAVEVCLLVETGGLDEGTLDFGVLEFGASATSDPYDVVSCADGDQQVLASGTDAAGVDADWSLVDDGVTRGLDEFSVSAQLAGVGDMWLASEPALVGVLGAGDSAVASHELLVPPAGSSGAGQTLSFEVQWIATSADTQPEVEFTATISPNPAYTSDILLCSIGGEPGGSFTYKWTVNGSVVGGATSSTLASIHFIKGDTVTCEATHIDSGQTRTDSLVIQNSPPVITSVMISPAEPSTSDDLTCTASGASDADGDPVSLLYAWTVNDLVTGSTGSTLASSNTAPDDTVECTVTPHDGTDAGTPVSVQVTIQSEQSE
jgi:hypothetical protein